MIVGLDKIITIENISTIDVIKSYYFLYRKNRRKEVEKDPNQDFIRQVTMVTKNRTMYKDSV